MCAFVKKETDLIVILIIFNQLVSAIIKFFKVCPIGEGLVQNLNVYLFLFVRFVNSIYNIVRKC